MNMVDGFNIFECFLWIIIGLAFVYRLAARKVQKEFFVTNIVLAVTFIVFGISDYIEYHTGAWWRPWWLMVMKAACILIFLLAVIKYYKWYKANKIKS